MWWKNFSSYMAIRLNTSRREARRIRKTFQSRQLIYAAVKRVCNILDEHETAGLVPVMVWLPPELAAQVKEMAKPYMDAPPAKAAKKDAKDGWLNKKKYGL